MTVKGDIRRSRELDTGGIPTHVRRLRRRAYVRFGIVAGLLLFGYVLYVWTTVAPQARGSALANWRRPVGYGMCIVLLSSSVFVLGKKWNRTRQFHAPHFKRAWLAFALMSMRVTKYSDRMIVFMAVGGVFAWCLTNSTEGVPGAGAYGIGLAIVFLVDRSLPPGIVLLGVSRRETLDIQMFTTWYAAPLPIASFLLESAADSFAVRRQARMLSFRVWPANGWGSVVRSLTSFCPVVAIDVRAMTPNVAAELSWMVAPERAFKLLVLGDLPAAAAAVATAFDPGQIATVTTEREYCQLVSVLSRGFVQPPRPNAPLAASLRECRSAQGWLTQV